jgi:hypothetical protein
LVRPWPWRHGTSVIAAVFTAATSKLMVAERPDAAQTRAAISSRLDF